MQPSRAIGIRIGAVSEVHRRGHGDILGWREENGNAPAASRPAQTNPRAQPIETNKSPGMPSPFARDESEPVLQPAGVPNRPRSTAAGSSEQAQSFDRLAHVKESKSAEDSISSPELQSKPSNSSALAKQNRPTALASAELVSVSSSLYDSVQDKHMEFLRALTSRIAELKSTITQWQRRDVDAWGGTPVTAHEGAYLSTLKAVRDECHEWAAVDVVRGLNACHADIKVFTSLSTDNSDDQTPPELAVQSIKLAGGVPPWSYPAYPRLPWARYLCPVWETLLYSVYEDYAMVALEGIRRALDALEPCFEAAVEVSPEDLEPPLLPPTGTHAGSEEEDSKGADKDDQASMDDEEAAQRMYRHVVATCAVEAVRRTRPLLAALAAAGSNPGPSAKLAHARARKLAQLHHSVESLVAASSSSST